MRLAGFQKRFPDRNGGRIADNQLEAVFARVARAADDRVEAAQQPAHRQMIVGNTRQRLVEERLHRLERRGPCTAIIAVSVVRSAKLPTAPDRWLSSWPTTFSRFDALQTTRNANGWR